VHGIIENPSQDPKILLDLFDPKGALISSGSLKVVNGTFQTKITVDKPQLWYPHMYGNQPLYTVTFKLPDHHSVSKTIGLRRLRLLQHPLKHAEGTSFVFEINDIRTFAGGSCWIPADFMLQSVTRQRYSEWLTLTKCGNQTMI
jgi:beta-mannosidase